MELNLKQKVVIVTGGGRGIVESICLAFAKEGTHIVVSDIDFENAKSVSERIRALGSKAIPVKTDVSRQEEAVKLVDLAVKEFGGIDVLVNNAGILPKKDGGRP